MKDRLWTILDRMMRGRVPAWQVAIIRGHYFREVSEEDARRVVREVKDLAHQTE